MRFSEREIKDLFIAWVLISIAFAIALRQTTSFMTNLWIALLTVGVAFVVHELAHKFIAQHYKKFAEFRASLPMLAVAILISFSGFVLAAPGAVVISGFVNKRQNGVIALAGPLSNFALAIILLPLYFLFSGDTMMSIIFGYGFLINAWLGLFNLIPFSVFDGAKILTWDKKVYAGMVLLGIVLVFFGSYIQAF